MKITIEEVPTALKNDIVRVGGECKYYAELDECFIAMFFHHTLHIEGDCAVIIDDLSGNSIVIERTDFYTIEII